jgi:cytochrome c biogenesis protein
MLTIQTRLFKTLLKKLATLQLAISLLFLIGITIAIGTVIEQDQSPSFYQNNYPINQPIFGFIDYNLIFNWQLNNVYSNFWFLTIIFIFGLSLLACTFTTQLPALKKFRLWEFLNLSTISKVPQFKGKLPKNLLNLVSYNIYTSNYHVFRQKTRNYAYSGLLGRVGPIVVHFSIILLLVGSSLGTLTSFTVQEIVPRGEVCHLQNFVKSGRFFKTPQDLSWRVNDFWVTYTQDSKTNQFYSDLSVLNYRGEELQRKTIFVNEPFFYKGVTIYQTDWDILGLKANVNNGKVVQLPLTKINKSGKNFWLGSFSFDNSSTNKFTVLLSNLDGRLNIYDNGGAFLKEATLDEIISFQNGNTIRFSDFITTTGLQAKSDDGLILVYFSFALLMISIYFSFLSYSQFWFTTNSKNVFVGGKSNRAVLSFQEQFTKTIQKTSFFSEKY